MVISELRNSFMLFFKSKISVTVFFGFIKIEELPFPIQLFTILVWLA